MPAGPGNGSQFALDSPLEGGGFEPSVSREGELHLCPFSSNSKFGQTTSQPEDLAKVLLGARCLSQPCKPS